MIVGVTLRGQSRCAICGTTRPRYDQMKASRWRHLDFGTQKIFLEMARWRVMCEECGVLAEEVPWASPKARFTYEFEDMVALLARHCDKSAVSSLMRISWPTVRTILDRTIERHQNLTSCRRSQSSESKCSAMQKAIDT